MQSHLITQFLDLEDVIVKKVSHSAEDVMILLETKPRVQKCPVCGNDTRRIHDYRFQIIKDVPLQLKRCTLRLKKRRYQCSCGKRFYEQYAFLPRYQQRTSRLTRYIASQFFHQESIKALADKANVSAATVNRILDTIHCERPSLGEAISIDEFKGNAENRRFQCILVDPLKHRVLDILPDRNTADLCDYFRSIPRNERFRVKFFSCDMCKPYTELAKVYFPNASIVIDRYHFVRQVSWALEDVRKDIQKTMPARLRKYYKRSKSLMLKRYDQLNSEQKKACDLMLLYNDDLRKAHYLKEAFLKICQESRYSKARTDLVDWICMAEKSGIKHFERCARTYRNWLHEILNSFKYRHISNGPTEGFNNKIKVLKRISYGIRRFDRFRTRILLSTT